MHFACWFQSARGQHSKTLREFEGGLQPAPALGVGSLLPLSFGLDQGS
jgi:hypothetical protein